MLTSLNTVVHSSASSRGQFAHLKPPLVQSRYPGHLFRRLHQDPLEFLASLGREYPECCRLKIFGRNVWALFEPDLIETFLTADHRFLAKGQALQRTGVLLGNGLLTAEGADHLRQRRTLQPAFHKRRIEGYAQVMARQTEKLSLRIVPNQTFDAHKMMMDLALGVVSRTVLGTDLDSQHDRISEALERVLGQFGLLVMPFFELIWHLPLPSMRRFRQSRDELFGVVDEIVDLHNRGESGTDSMLHLLEGIDPVRIKDEVLTMLLAGHETTANLMTFAIDLLARHPDLAQPVYREARELLGNREATAADYPLLGQTRRVMQEVLRLYPPAWAVGRRTLQELKLGRYTVPKDVLLLAPQWVVQRDSRHFPNPHAFEPDRWLTAEPSKGQFFPFGGGTRICIGEGFARMEAVLAIATLARDWTFTTPSSEAPSLWAGITLRPKSGLPVRFERAD